jgi:ParB-like chromosome segregation protein Spo0J
MNSSIVKPLPLAQIDLDKRAQPRVSMNQDVVNEYARDIDEGAVFPPITVFYDGTQHWLADGFHRYQAHQQTGADTVMAEVREGTLKDAILHSVSANARHGLRRSNEDKRRAVRVMLEDDEWRMYSDTEIAARCRVSRPLVAALRKEETSHPAELQDRRIVKRGGKSYRMDLTKMRRTREETESGHRAEDPDRVVAFMGGGKSHAMKTENIGPNQEESPSISKPEPKPETPRAERVIGILLRICDDFSGLPTATTAARLIKDQQAPFIGKQASEVGTWFRHLAYLLDGGSIESRGQQGTDSPENQGLGCHD